MGAIFISYRRSDAEGQAGRLFEGLCQRFGRDAVFIDVAGLAKGRDFRRILDDRLASCGVLLAIIGKNWLTAADEDGRRRLDNADDFIRLETSAALKRDIPVIPVLVQGAQMPRADELPEDLKDLAFREGTELTHTRWESDVQELIKALLPYMQERSGSLPLPSPPPAKRWWRIIGPAAAIIVLIATGYVAISIYQKESARVDAALKDAEAARASAKSERLAREKAEIDAETATAELKKHDAESNAKGRAVGVAGRAADTQVKPGAEPAASEPRIDHPLVSRVEFRNSATSRLYYYDINSGVQRDSQAEADFFFKADNYQDPKTRIGVSPTNGAKFAPRFAGQFPWGVELNNFVSSGGASSSVEQGVAIPCFTRDKRPCTFQVRLEPRGEMIVSIALYK